MLKYMLDTNMTIYVIKRRPIAVLEVFNRHAGQMCVSSITLAELLHGVEKSANPEHNSLPLQPPASPVHRFCLPASMPA